MPGYVCGTDKSCTWRVLEDSQNVYLLLQVVILLAGCTWHILEDSCNVSLLLQFVILSAR